MYKPQTIIEFWANAGPESWFKKDDAFDRAMVAQFKSLPDEIAQGNHQDWQTDAHGMLALILALDQFPRNMFRGTPKSFAFDELGLKHARTSIDNQWDAAFTPPLRRFFYLPFMHSEAIKDQHFCIELCRKSNDQEGIDYGMRHLEVIEKFGRFPHRNEILGRPSTPEERAYLNTEGAGF